LYLTTGIFSIVTLINNRFIVLFFAFFICLLIYTIIKKYNLLKTCIIPLLIVFIILSPWFIRQYFYYDQFVFFTPTWNNVVADKLGFLKRVNVTTDADIKLPDKPYNYQDYINCLRSFNTIETQNKRISAFTTEKYNELIKKHDKQENIRLYRLREYFSLYNTDFQFIAPNDYRLNAPATSQHKLVQLFILLPIFIFSLVGFIIALRKKEVIIIMLAGLFFSHLLLHTMIHYIERYRLTILTVLVIIASYGFVNLISNRLHFFHKNSKIFLKKSF
jgi:hypothetical protein